MTERQGVDDLVRQEVIDLHRFLEGWLKGDLENTGTGPVRLMECLSDDFFVIHPDGGRDGKAGVLRNFNSAYGQKGEEYALEIGRIWVQPLEGGYVLATYEETHRGELGRERIGTALLRRRPESAGFEWLFLQETPVASA